MDTMDTYLIPRVCSGLRGHSRFVLECEYFPPIAAYRDKAIRGRTLALLNEKSKQPQIEHEQKGIPMPEKFKELIKDLKK